MNILLSCGRAPAILNLAQELHALGFGVYVVDTQKSYLTRYSKSIQKAFTVPRPDKHLKKFTDSLNHIISEYNIEWVIPGYEDTFYFSIIKSELSQRTKIFTSSINLLDSLHNKESVQKIIRSEHVQNLSTEVITQKTLKYWLSVKDKFVFKPTYSRFGDSTIINLGGDQLPNIYDNKWLGQKKIAGEEISTFAACHQGTVIVSCIYKRDMVVGPGAGIAFHTIDDNNLQSFIIEQVKNLNYTGFIGFDIMKDQNKYFLLECNPRITSGIHLVSIAPFAELLRLKNDRVKAPEQGFILKQRKLILPVIIYSINNLLQSKISARHLLRVLRKYNSIVFSTRDVLPFIMSIWIYIGYILRSMLSSITITELTGEGIIWDGERETYD
jgi:predicted ATP-grasp superfamily ATP-dependent carboligase